MKNQKILRTKSKVMITHDRIDYIFDSGTRRPIHELKDHFVGKQVGPMLYDWPEGTT